MLWVCVVLDDVMGPPNDPVVVDILQRREGCSTDVLGSFYDPLESLPVLYSAVSMPHCDGADDDAHHCTFVEVAEYFGCHTKLLQFP